MRQKLVAFAVCVALVLTAAWSYAAGEKNGTRDAFDHSVFPAGCKPKPSPTGPER